MKRLAVLHASGLIALLASACGAGDRDAVEPQIQSFRVVETVTSGPVTIDMRESDEGSGVVRWLIVDGSSQRPSVAEMQAGLADRPSTYDVVGGDGVHILYGWVMDASENVSRRPAVASVELDATPPAIELFEVEDDFTSGPLAIRLRESDRGTGVVRWLVRDAPGLPTPGQMWAAGDRRPLSFDLGGADGPHTLRAWVMDAAGNLSPAAATDIVALDTTPPVISSFTIAEAATRGPVTLAMTEVEDGSGIAHWLIVDGQWLPTAEDIRGGSGARPTDFLITGEDGVHTLYAWALDAVGNVSEQPATASVRLDTEPPAIDAFDVVESVTTRRVSLRMTESEEVTRWYISDSSPVRPTEEVMLAAAHERPTAFNVAGEDGGHTLYGWVMDQAGNINRRPGSDTVRLDTTAPTVTVDALTTFDDKPALSGSVDDQTATLDIEVGGQSVTASNRGDGSWLVAAGTLDSLADGTYDVAVSATDPVGNVGTDGTVDELIIEIPFFDSTLVGPWLVLPESEDEVPLYLVMDGEGIIVEVGAFASASPGGVYSVQRDGTLAMTVFQGAGDGVDYAGRVQSDTSASIDAPFSGRLLRAEDTASTSGSWSGSLWTAPGFVDVRFALNSDGEITSFDGLSGPVHGKLFTSEGRFVGHWLTTEEGPLNELVVFGDLAGSEAAGPLLSLGGELGSQTCAFVRAPVQRAGVEILRPRAQLTAVALEDGSVLYAGGEHDHRPESSAEIYDVAADAVHYTEDEEGSQTFLSAGRRGAVLIGLAEGDGRALVVSGEDADGPLAHSDLFDPSTGVFTRVEGMGVGRVGHAAVLLNDGRVLVVGGVTGPDADERVVVPEIDIFAPADGESGSWSTFNSGGGDTMATARYRPMAHVLNRGGPRTEVLVTGGFVSTSDEGEEVGPVLAPPNALAQTGFIISVAPGEAPSVGPPISMTSPRAGHAVAVLSSGDALLFGGVIEIDPDEPLAPLTLTDSAELYDASDGVFVALPGLLRARSGLSASVMRVEAKEVVLLAAGFEQAGDRIRETAFLEVYDPDAGSAVGGLLPSLSGEHVAVVVPHPDDPARQRIVLLGGEDGSRTARGRIDLYDP